MPRSSTFLRLVVATGAACALIPAAANAATVSGESGQVVYRGEGAEGNDLLVSKDSYGSGQLVLRDYGADRLAVLSGPCQPHPEDSTSVLCPMGVPVVIEGSEAKDSISIFSAAEVPDSIPFTIRGNGGDDTIKDAYDGLAGRTLEGGAGNDTIDGYQGDDVIDGGPGNDKLDGGGGNDQIRAGEGDDALSGDRYFKTPGADLLDGGPGTDSVEDWSIPDEDIHPPATVTLDGAANDGRPGEGDNVVGVETFKQYIATTFVGSDAPEVVDIVNPADPLAPNDIKGMGGNDQLKGSDASDTVDGGAGDDLVQGAMGNDTVIGGPGKDQIFGDATGSHCSWYSCKVPYGNDIIQARDGEADTIDCGVGEDTAYVDAVDTVAGCEKVETGPAAAGPAPGQGAATTGAAAGATLKLAGGKTRSALLGGKLALQVPCGGPCTVAVKGTYRRTTVLTGKATLLAPGTAKVKLKAARTARKALRGKGKAKISIAVTIKGADGAAVKAATSVTVR